MNIADPRSAAEVQRFFAGMGWPVPAMHEYYQRSMGAGHLVFMNDYGLVVRITPQNRVLNTNSHRVIMPIFNRQAGHFKLDIVGGYNGPLSYEKTKAVDQALADEGIKNKDQYNPVRGNNYAELPKTGFGVLIDDDPRYVRVTPAAIRKLSLATNWVKRTLDEMTNARPRPKRVIIPNPQEVQYALLISILKEAWPESADKPDCDGIRQFKEACLDYKGKGLLLTPWRQHDYKGTTLVAENYARRLAAERCAPEI